MVDAKPGQGHALATMITAMETGLIPLPNDLEARKACFAQELQLLDVIYHDEDYDDELPVFVSLWIDDSTAGFAEETSIPIQAPVPIAERCLKCWLYDLPFIVEVYLLPALPLYQRTVNSFEPIHQDQAQEVWLSFFLRHTEDSPDTEWTLHQRNMDDSDNAEAANAQLNGADDADDADLFGSDSGSVGSHNGDVGTGDEDRRESAKEDTNDKGPVHTREENVIDVSIGNHAIPKPSDGELYLLQFPSYLGIEPRAFTPSDWKPPTTEHHSAEAPSSTFSAFSTSNNTARWRHAPDDAEKLQSNARILRWSDGSLTLQIASNPREQFALTAKALAPPQLNPETPTPTSLRGNQAVGKKPYDARLDSHTFLASNHESVGMLRLTNHVTASLAVQSLTDQDDDATLKLQETMAAATKGQHGGDGGIGIMHITEDPELAKKRAEIAEKEKTRAARRRQLQEEKERERNNRVLGRSGLRTSGGFGGGLTIGGLEDDEGGLSRPRPRAANKPKARKPRRRNSEYSDEEDYMTRGRTKEDEYDEEDGFLVGSDEEPEIAGDASDEEELSEMEKEERRSKKSGARKEVQAVVNAPAPAAGAGSPKGRVKRRRVIDDEDDDE